MSEASDGAPVSEDVTALVPKRRLWPIALVLILLLAGGAAGVYVASTSPEPMRVLVAIDLDGHWWEGSKPAAALADQLALRLEKLGFEPVKAGDPEVTRTLERAESPQAAAAKLGASFVITARLEPELIEHPVQGGYFEVRVKGPVELAWRKDAPERAGEVSTWAGAKQKERALEVAAESIADMTFDAVMPAIVGHASMQKLLEGPATERAKLSLAKGYVELREKRLSEARKAYQDLTEKHAREERGPLKVEYHGALDRVAALCAATPRGFLIKTSSIEPFFAPSQNELRYVLKLERLSWLGAAASDAPPVFEGYNVYGYATAGRTGEPIVLVEDLFGWAKTITIVDKSGKPKRLRVDPKHRFADPKVAPGGGAVALWDRECQGCPASLLVLALPDGKELFRTDAKAVSLGGFTWLGPKLLAYLERPLAPEPKPGELPPAEGTDAGGAEKAQAALRQRLIELDLSGAEPARREAHVAIEGESLSSPAASNDGQLIALQRRSDDGLHLAIFDRQTGKLTAHDVGGWIENPSVSPDGSRIAFERSGEIAVYTIATGNTRALTKNSFVERYPLFSADGKRIAFESRDRDPNFSSRSVSVIASVTLN